eukprot:RCo011910
MSAKHYKLSPEEELRFEVGDDEEGLLKLTEAAHQHAEIFGAELAPRRVYCFPAGSKLAVWTWHGCHVQLEGCSEAYPHRWHEETPMSKYAAVHLKLEEMRQHAVTYSGAGPRVMVCGPHDSGKNSLCRILVNYAARQGRSLVFADLDPAANEICAGCVAGVPIEQPVGIEDAFTLLPHLAYFIGEMDPATNPDLFLQGVTNLSNFVKLRGAVKGNERAKHGGGILNTSGFVEKEAYENLVKTVQIFDVNYIVVLDDEKLMARLSHTFKPQPGALGLVTNQNGTPLLIEKVVKSGGVVQRDPATRSKEFSFRVREYFYGSRCHGGHSLRPHRMVVSFDDLTVYRIGGHKVPSYLLPAGASSTIEPCQLHKLDPSEAFLHLLGGLSHATGEVELRTANIAGLIHFQAVDMVHRRYTLLVPSPGALPGRFAIVGSMKWLDTT